ncbi:MAG: NeuD/PglB/VioB family sugar acetyltransferase [Anaerolineales bacterium]|nr:NeuD/PglB/VioB family sugar acetyltransferase [Anaerolineales bacterium]
MRCNLPEPILIPLLNPNEPEALLAGLHITEGQQVSKGDLLFTLETTKSTAEVEAEGTGYIAALRFSQGQTVRAGDILCYLAEQPDWKPEADSGSQSLPRGSESSVPEGMRITQPALALAHQSGLDLSQFPPETLITESMVRGALQKSAAKLAYTPTESAFDPTSILIYGGGGHGKALIDLLRTLRGYQIVGILDDGFPAGETVMGLPILGGGEKLPELYAQGVRLAVNAVGGIGNIAVRISVFKRLAQAGFACPALIHPSAFVEASARLSPGVQVFPHAYVGSEAKIGFGVIINTGAIVSHECSLGDYANISPGAILAGQVEIGPGALVGMGATINLRARIGAGARVGNGATVKSDVPENGIVRAGAAWPD